MEDLNETWKHGETWGRFSCCINKVKRENRPHVSPFLKNTIIVVLEVSIVLFYYEKYAIFKNNNHARTTMKIV